MTTTSRLKKFMKKMFGLDIEGNSPAEIMTKAATANVSVETKFPHVIGEYDELLHMATYHFATQNDMITSNDNVIKILASLDDDDRLLWLTYEMIIDDKLWRVYGIHPMIFIGQDGQICDGDSFPLEVAKSVAQIYEVIYPNNDTVINVGDNATTFTYHLSEPVEIANQTDCAIVVNGAPEDYGEMINGQFNGEVSLLAYENGVITFTIPETDLGFVNSIEILIGIPL